MLLFPPADPSDACFVPGTRYRASSTKEIVSVAVIGNVMVATRGEERWLPDSVALQNTDSGNWTIAVGEVGCRGVRMHSGFRALASVGANGTIDWLDRGDETWDPEPSCWSWESWFCAFEWVGYVLLDR